MSAWGLFPTYLKQLPFKVCEIGISLSGEVSFKTKQSLANFLAELNLTRDGLLCTHSPARVGSFREHRESAMSILPYSSYFIG